MPRSKSNKKNTSAQAAQAAQASQAVIGQGHDDPDYGPELSPDLYEQRYHALFMEYRTQLMAEFKAENAGPKLDKVIAHVAQLDKIGGEIEVAANDLDEKLTAYLNSGANMSAVLAAQRKINKLQEDAALLSGTPAGCNELLKAYRKVLNADISAQ
jgi:hypothetical protein